MMLGRDANALPKHHTSLLQSSLKLSIGAGFWETTIVAGRPRAVRQLDPPAGRQVVVGLLQEARPGRDAAAHGADVDVVEGVI